MNLPQYIPPLSISPVASQGTTASVSAALEVGAGNISLTLDKATRILLPNQSGKLAGYIRNGVFSKITSTCSADTQVAGDVLNPGSECKIDVGSDLIIWTKHFTTFVAYSETPVSTPSATQAVSAGGGMIAGLYGTVNTPDTLLDAHGIPITNSTKNTSQTISGTGGSTDTNIETDTAKTNDTVPNQTVKVWAFTQIMHVGTISNEVAALQTLLTQDGFYDGPISGKVGALTYAATRKYQQAHSLKLTGLVDKYTMNALNSEMSEPISIPDIEVLVSTMSSGDSTQTDTQTTFTRTLVIGDTGDDVTALQNLLTKDGFYTGPITGKVGALTYAAVRKYQYAHNIKLSGYTDAQTRAALNAE